MGEGLPIREVPREDPAGYPQDIDDKHISALEARLLSAMVHTRSGHTLRHGLPNNWEVLQAILTVCAACLYQFADDQGAGLRDLLQQFGDRLYERICCYEHDTDFHRAGDPGHTHEDDDAEAVEDA